MRHLQQEVSTRALIALGQPMLLLLRLRLAQQAKTFSESR
jgi:hypothetical protein